MKSLKFLLTVSVVFVVTLSIMLCSTPARSEEPPTTYNVNHVARVQLIQFSPDCEADKGFKALFEKAVDSIYISIYSFYSEEIQNYLLQAKQENPELDVRVLFGYAQSVRSEVDETLSEAGIQVRFDRESGYHHNKFAVVDDRWVLTGSFNFSARAQCRNRENYLVLASPRIAEVYKTWFLHLWDDYGQLREALNAPPG